MVTTIQINDKEFNVFLVIGFNKAPIKYKEVQMSSLLEKQLIKLCDENDTLIEMSNIGKLILGDMLKNLSDNYMNKDLTITNDRYGSL